MMLTSKNERMIEANTEKILRERQLFLKKIEQKPDKFTFDVLKDEYGIYAIRGPRGITNSLSEALK